MSQPEDLEVLSKKAETVKIRWPFYREMIERLVPLLTESIRQTAVCVSIRIYSKVFTKTKCSAGVNPYSGRNRYP